MTTTTKAYAYIEMPAFPAPGLETVYELALDQVFSATIDFEREFPGNNIVRIMITADASNFFAHQKGINQKTKEQILVMRREILKELAEQ